MHCPICCGSGFVPEEDCNELVVLHYGPQQLVRHVLDGGEVALCHQPGEDSWYTGVVQFSTDKPKRVKLILEGKVTCRCHKRKEKKEIQARRQVG
jgi:hypothetical protein